MDKVKIGQFISECRKSKHLTQEQLAEMLDVSNKSVSKWENGLCMPDTSLFEPLCQILGITLNELFVGESVPTEDPRLLQMMKHKLYGLSDKTVTFADFDRALSDIAEISAKLRSFPTKEAAVSFLEQETGSSAEACAGAYDFYVGLFPLPENGRIDYA